MKRLLVLLGALVAVLLGGALVLAGDASAHATVVGSDPADGSRLKSVPATVTIDFDENVGIADGLGYLHVVNSAGTRVENGSATHPGGDGTKVSVALKSGLPDGTYTESYRVISADSHPVAGVVRFVVGNGPLTTTAVAGVGGGAVNHTTGVVFDVVKWLSWAGFALLGGSWLLLTVWPEGRDERRARAVVWTGWAAAGLGGLLEVLVQGAYASGQSLAHLVQPSLVDATLHSDYGQWHCVRLVVLGVIGVLLGAALQPRERRARFELAVLPLLVGTAVTFSAIGHADTTNPAWLSIALDVLHLCAMATWVGGLVLIVVAVLPRYEPDETAAVLPVFSKAAFVSVVVLAISGTYAGWRGTDSWRGLFTTEYGLLIIAKVVLFLGLMALANLSRRVVQRRLVRPRVVAYANTDVVDTETEEDEDDESEDDTEYWTDVERLRRSVLIEAAVALIVLAVTAVLVGQPRGPETIAARDRQPVIASASLGSGDQATVTVDPGEHGTVELQLALTGDEPSSVTGTAALPAQQLGPIPLKLSPDGKDLYTAQGVDLPSAGDWTFQFVVTRSEFDAITVDVPVHLN